MASELCMNCFSVKGQYEVCPYCGYIEGTPPVQPHCLTPGTILGNHFIVGTVIGFGGFGITYKCYDTTLGITVAAKEFYPIGLVNRSPGQNKVGVLSGEKRVQYREQLKRFLMEAQSVAQFGKAKDIVNIYDYFEENGTAYIIMEYIDGILLKDYLEKQGAMPPEVALSVIMPIIEAVKKIHSKGIIHRDISPDNIFITDEKSIKVFDFGAALLNDTKEGMAGEKVIKVGYSAPEQYRDKSRQGFYTDIYSVGAILYQMLTGRKPVESTEREYKDRLKSPMELGVKLNSNVDRAVMEAMAVRPELRYQGIQQFEEALRNKRVAEYPKDKIRRKKRKRNWIIGTTVTLVLALGVTITLMKTVLKPESEIFDSTINKDTTITIWVENEDQKKQLEELEERGFKKGDLDNSEWEKFWKENEKVTVNVEVQPDMETAFANTPEENRPNMYLTDHVSSEQKKDLVSLEGLYEELDADENYAYLDRNTYEQEFPDYTELPTGLDTTLVYICNLETKDENTLEEKSKVIADAVNAGTIKESDLMALFQDNGQVDGQVVVSDTQEKKDMLTFYKPTLMACVVANDSDWSKLFEGQDIIPNSTMLSGIQKMNSEAYLKPYQINAVSSETESDEGEVLFEAACGNNIVAGAAFRKYATVKEEENSQEQKDLRNKVESFDTYIVLNDKGEMPVIYSERYGIRASSDKSQITACKRMLYVMMNEVAQEKKINTGIETTFPILKDQLEKFAETHNNMTDFKKLYGEKADVMIIGNITGDMYQYIKKADDSKIKEESALTQYCSEYINSRDTGQTTEETTGQEETTEDISEEDISEENISEEEITEEEITEEETIVEETISQNK